MDEKQKFPWKQISLSLTLMLIAVIAAGGVLPQAIPALADGPADVQVSLSAPDEVVPDSNFTVTVNITQVEGFDASNYDVSSDKTVLRLDNVAPDQIGSTTVPVDIWNENPSGSGKFTIVQNVPGLSGVNGSGYLSVLHFHVIGTQRHDEIRKLFSETAGILKF